MRNPFKAETSLQIPVEVSAVDAALLEIELSQFRDTLITDQLSGLRPHTFFRCVFWQRQMLASHCYEMGCI